MKASVLRSEAHERSLEDSLAKLLLSRVETEGERGNGGGGGLTVNALFKSMMDRREEESEKWV